MAERTHPGRSERVIDFGVASQMQGLERRCTHCRWCMSPLEEERSGMILDRSRKDPWQAENLDTGVQVEAEQGWKRTTTAAVSWAPTSPARWVYQPMRSPGGELVPMAKGLAYHD